MPSRASESRCIIERRVTECGDESDRATRTVMDARGVGASDSEESMWSLPVRVDGRNARERARRRRFDSIRIARPTD